MPIISMLFQYSIFYSKSQHSGKITENGCTFAQPLFLSFDIVIHIHQIAYALNVVGNVAVAVNGVLDNA